ncbi:oligogalacturonate-specific porin KdgM family protein [Erwinia mallotivora]|nr:oligogalacturonate-specific porin KdgM family protein [Erwinia mallotivora]
MKKLMMRSILVMTGITSATNVMALEFTSPALDFREAWMSGSKMFQTKLQISTVIEKNVYFSYQNTINHGKDFSQFKNNYSEIEMAYNIPVTDKFSIIPDAVFNWGRSGTHIDPYLKLGYQLTPDIGLMAGYRYYHLNYKSVNLDGDQQRNDSHEYDLWFNWQVTDRIFFNYNPVYLHKAGNFYYGNNKKSMWQHTVYFNYRYDQHWLPYIDLSDLGRAGNGEKEYRIRMGIRYSF